MNLLLRRLWIQISADRKRFGVLCGMLLLGMLLWGRIIVTSNLPRTAIANPAGNPTGKGTARGGTQRREDPSDKPRNPPIKVRLSRLPNRDPLLISDKHFPKPTTIDALTTDRPKSRPEAVENPEQAEARLTEQLRAMVGRFRLEAVMQGSEMRAVINGKRYALHGWIPAVDNDSIRFQLIQVGHRSVILECEGRQFELTMNFPGTDAR